MDDNAHIETPAAPEAAQTTETPSGSVDAEAVRREAFEKATSPQHETPAEGVEPSEPRSEKRGPKEDRPAADGEGDAPESAGADPDASGGDTKPAGKPEPKAEPAAETTPEQREGVALARMALRRDGWSDDELASIPRERLIALGEKRRTAQAEQDSFRLRVEQAAASRRTQTTDDPEREPESDEEDDADSLDKLLEELEGKTPAKASDKAKQPDPKAPQASEQVTRLQAELFQTRMHSITNELSKDFPDVASKEGLPKLLAAMARLDPDERMAHSEPELRDLVREAAWMAFGESRVKREAEKTQKQERAKRTRSELSEEPDVGGGGDAPARRKSPEDIRREAFELATADR